jgi:dTDP-4-amino-4,6-dideoxygalactose transaminase
VIRLSKSIIDHLEERALKRVLAAGYLGMGSEVKSFEEELSAYLSGEKKSVVCVNSGTAALHLALQALGVGPGDEVIVPTFTFVASFQAISATGATPVACDVLENNALIDLDDAKNRVTSKTKAIMPVHYASYPGDLNSVYAFAKRYGLCVVEDAAHAFGCEYQGQKIGGFGDTVCFSFDGIKNITSGEGGAIVTSDEKIIEKIKDARLLGVIKDSDNRYLGKRSWDFDVAEQGWRYHMSDLMAAIGRVQLQRFEGEFKPIRQNLAKRYRSLLKANTNIGLFDTDLKNIIPHIMPIRVFNGKRNVLKDSLESAGIQTGIHYKPNHLLTKYKVKGVDLPVAEKLYSEILTLPLHPELTYNDVDLITNIVNQISK